MVLAYDTRTNRQWGLPTAHIEAQEVTFKWCGMVSIATTLYATPCTSMKVLIVDTVTSVVSGVAVKLPSLGGQKWVGAVVVGSSVYAPPSNAFTVLEFETGSRSVSGHKTSGVEPDATVGKWAGIGNLGTTVYAAPRAGGAKSVLVFDTGSRRVSGISTAGLPGRAGWWGFVA